jgi:hypothetical protein
LRTGLALATASAATLETSFATTAAAALATLATPFELCLLAPCKAVCEGVDRLLHGVSR